MTKADELKILSDAAKKLGNDSYLGNALLELLPFVESEMRSDIFPDLAGTIRRMERDLVAQRTEMKELDAKIKEKKEEVRKAEYAHFLAENKHGQVKDQIRETIERLKNCL